MAFSSSRPTTGSLSTPFDSARPTANGFTLPRPTGDGKSIAPTGRAYRIPMATIGHWGKDGSMLEERLFWDNGEFMKKIGLGQ
jgi:hypothetical protein